MTEHDVLEVVALEEACGLSLWGWDGYYTDPSRSDAIRIVARPTEAPAGICVVGFVVARIAEKELHINNLAVVEGSRRSGVGTALLVAALNEAREAGSNSASLEVRASNKAALELYRRNGISVAGRRKNYS